jgi:hypothetical protein
LPVGTGEQVEAGLRGVHLPDRGESRFFRTATTGRGMARFEALRNQAERKAKKAERR